MASSQGRCGADQQAALDWCVTLGRLAEVASCMPQSRRAFECTARTSSRCEGTACCSKPPECADSYVAFDHCARGYCGGHSANPDCGWIGRGEAPTLSFLSPPPPAPPAPADPDDSFAALLDAGIRMIDDTHYVIKSSLVDQVLLNPMAIAKSARIVPAMKNGQPEGFKLYAIRVGSLWARIGLANGDTLRTINGFALDSADKALEVYTKLREATSFELELVRRGAPLTLWITITNW